MEYFLYMSDNYPNRFITIGQREDLTFFISKAIHLTEDENRFGSVSQIEEYLDDTLTMVQRPE